MAEENEGFIDRVNTNLEKYFKSHNAEYDNAFENWCDNNGYDNDDEVKGEIYSGEEETLIDADADEFKDFPYPPGTIDENKKGVFLKILQECAKENPDLGQFSQALPEMPEFNKALFQKITNDHVGGIKKLYGTQCSSIYKQGMQTDNALLQVIALGKEEKIDYLQHLVDCYDRARVQKLKDYPKENGKLHTGQWMKEDKHMLKLDQFDAPKLAGQGPDIQKASDLVKAAVDGYRNRLCNGLQLNPTTIIDNSLENILEYLDAGIIVVSNLVKEKMDVCPFQFDMCIAVGKPVENKETDNDDDDEDDKEEFIDYIGNIQEKLVSNKVAAVRMKRGELFTAREFAAMMRRLSGETLDKGEVWQSNLPNKMSEKYPFKKRLIAMIDRRTGKGDEDKNEDVFMYEPPKEMARDLPDSGDIASEWGVAAARTCLLPPMKYDGKVADEEEAEDSKDKNIHATFNTKGGLLTFSFQCKSAEQMKCYMYYNTQMIRIFPEEIEVIFPRIFNMDGGENKGYFKSPHFVKKTMDSIKGKLVDTDFEAFKRCCEK